MKFTVTTATGLEVASYEPTTSIREEYITQLLNDHRVFQSQPESVRRDIARAIVYLANEPVAVSTNLSCGFVVSRVEQTPFQKTLAQTPKLPQRQDSTNAQLHDLRIMANRLGMYDAADVILNLLQRRT